MAFLGTTLIKGWLCRERIDFLLDLSLSCVETRVLLVSRGAASVFRALFELGGGQVLERGVDSGIRRVSMVAGWLEGADRAPANRRADSLKFVAMRYLLVSLLNENLRSDSLVHDPELFVGISNLLLHRLLLHLSLSLFFCELSARLTTLGLILALHLCVLDLE